MLSNLFFLLSQRSRLDLFHSYVLVKLALRCSSNSMDYKILVTKYLEHFHTLLMLFLYFAVEHRLQQTVPTMADMVCLAYKLG